MENEDVIRDQMEDTRTSLTEKLETLEQKVASTVDSAATNVAETVEAVKETVQETVSTVKDTVQDTICTVKETVREGVGAVKDAFDIPGHVERHPWLMLGGSVALGYVVGRLVSAGMESAKFEAKGQAGQDREAWEHEGAVSESSFRRSSLGALNNGHNGHTEHPSNEQRMEPETPEKSKEGIGGWLKMFAPEIDKLKGLAIGALMGTLRETVSQAAPKNVQEPLVDVIDRVTEKLGGDPVPQQPPQEEQGEERNPRWASAT